MMLFAQSYVAIFIGALDLALSSVFRLLIYWNTPLNFGQRMWKMVGWVDLQQRNIETVFFILQSMGWAWIVLGLAYSDIKNNLKVSLVLDDFLVFGLIFGPLFGLVGLLYWASKNKQKTNRNRS
jgi:hypothetical protein